MVPAIQLMMRVERDAETQRRPSREGFSKAADKELSRLPVYAKRLTHIVSRLAITGDQTTSVHNQGMLQCNCAN